MKNTNKKALKSPLFTPNEAQDNTIEKVNTEPKHFEIIYDTIYKNRELNGYDLAILLYLITRAPTYKPTEYGIRQALQFSEHKYKESIAKLKEKGYLEIIRKGRNQHIYKVSQKPTLKIKDEMLNFESLSKLMNIDYYYELYNLGLIDKELHTELIKYVYAVVNGVKWTKK